MSLLSRIFSVAGALGAVFCCSCEQTMPASKGSVGVRNYSDAVVHINQVDPAYRAYFKSQDAANYSISDQRKAYFAAAETARTPVREADYRPGDVRKATARTASKGKKTSALARNSKTSIKAAAKKSSVGKRAVAVRKPYRRR